MYYSPWDDPFSTSFAQAAWDHDAYVLVQLEPKGVTLASIAAGGSDAYLRSYADAVVAFGHPVILSFGHEMNGTWYSWGYGHASPATFVAAWRHVVRVFRAAGAANVTWLWTVNSIAGASSSLSQWWPGAAWVDWTGVDGYYFRATDTLRLGVRPDHRGHPHVQQRAAADRRDRGGHHPEPGEPDRRAVRGRPRGTPRRGGLVRRGAARRPVSPGLAPGR